MRVRVRRVPWEGPKAQKREKREVAIYQIENIEKDRPDPSGPAPYRWGPPGYCGGSIKKLA